MSKLAYLEPNSDALSSAVDKLGLMRADFKIAIPTGTSFEDWAWYFSYGTKFLTDCDKQELLAVCKELCREVQKLSAENTELERKLKGSVVIDPTALLG